MSIATPTTVLSSLLFSINHSSDLSRSYSMSQDYHYNQGIFTFSNGFDRSSPSLTNNSQQPPQPQPHQIAIFQDSAAGSQIPVYEPAGMLSEMFSFPGSSPTSVELLGQSLPSTYNPSPIDVITTKQLLEQHQQHRHHHHQNIPALNATDSASVAATSMQLSLMNPQRSPSPSPQESTTNNNGHNNSSNLIHMLLPDHHQGYTTTAFGVNDTIQQQLHHQQFTWSDQQHQGQGPIEIETVHVEGGQGLSLSLSSSLVAAAAAKAEEYRNIYYGSNNHGGVDGTSSSSNTSTHNQYDQFKGLSGTSFHHHHNHHQAMGLFVSASSIGGINILRNSKYTKAAQELLEEFCSVGRSAGNFKKNKYGIRNNTTNSTTSGDAGGGGSSPPVTEKDQPSLSAADRIEHQRRKVKLLSMLEEMDRRYSHYCEQMRMVVNSFDLVMGYGSAVPYTALAQKAMSRHFRCLKDSISTQLKHSRELLGEKDAAGTTSSGLTKGETPRLRLLEQSLRQQRAFSQMGLMEQEAWRPQRGLPERSVNILRAWLFEHFLNPYPSDADKHQLARQTGLSRNQVSNWFINARVRLWKPMVEEMYQQEAKEGNKEEQEERRKQQTDKNTKPNNNNIIENYSTAVETNAQTPTPSTTDAAAVAATGHHQRSEIFIAHENDPSLLLPSSSSAVSATCQYVTAVAAGGFGTANANANPCEIGNPMMRFGTKVPAGDVSLTLGLRHTGNIPDKDPSFSIRDFGGF